MGNERKKGRIFEFAILFHPAPKNANEIPGPTELLVEPKHIIASDEQEALIPACRAIPEDFLDRLQEVEIAVVPF